MWISTIDRVDNDGAAQQHEQPEDGEHGLGEAEAGTDLGLGRGPIYYICWHPGGEMMSRPGLGQDTIPDTGHGHWDNLGKLDSVIPIPSAV